ncbi:MAG: hypothetical protein GY874_01800, partial [Desulfobacteraceae bacterium]|nr:hypothetical protein [Desulfobacteraceae bacterium]
MHKEREEEFASLLYELKDLIQSECIDGIKPVIGGDFNSILGTRNHYDDSLDINKCLGPNGYDEINERGKLVVSELLESLDLCNPASFFIKESYTTWVNDKSVAKDTTNTNHTLDYILAPFSDMKGLIRDSGISTRLTCHTTDHTAVALLYSYPSDKNPKRKSTKKKRNKKSHSEKPRKRDLLHEDTRYADNYNQKVKELIIDCLHENDKTIIDQPSLIPILVEASKSFPEMKSSKNDWFKKDEENLLKLISEKNENERNLRLNKNNDRLRQSCRKSRLTLKKAIKNAKENWMKEEISKLLNIKVDPLTAWQASKRIQSGLSHHHTDSKDKYTKLKRKDGTLTDNPE